MNRLLALALLALCTSCSDGAPPPPSPAPPAVSAPLRADEVAPMVDKPARQCEPPYWIDGNMHRHYKIECLMP